jgi:putative ATP-dependent endonuclease of the OLD family
VFIDRIAFENFRNLSGTVALSWPLTVIVGPNNAGKSNVIDGLRMTLTPQSGGFRERLTIERDDFRHDGDGQVQSDELEIAVGFGGLTTSQRGRMLTMLDASAGPDRASLRLRATLPEYGRPKRPLFYGGSSSVPEVEDWARDAVTFTALPALRDAEDELRPGRATNRLVALLSAFAPTPEARDEIVALVEKANHDMRQLKAMSSARESVEQRLERIVGLGYGQGVDLLFAEPRFERVVGALRALIGDYSVPQEMSQNGLGYNNLLFMATLLAGLAEEPEGELHVLLVEEPEAHLHPQLQDLLMRFLEQEATAGHQTGRVQVIVTTHSPNLSSAARVERITSMVRRVRPNNPNLRQSSRHVSTHLVADFKLAPDELDHLARFLDVTKASLLFARAVLLVEGLAEQLLMPILARSCEPPLSLLESQVTVVNVGGLAFGAFAHLYAPDRLPSRCAIISDADPPEPEADGRGTTDRTDDEPDPVLSATAEKLLGDQNDNRRVWLATKTFEWDLVAAGNWNWALLALKRLHPYVARRLESDATLVSDEARATAILNAVEREKGRFAQALAHVVDELDTTAHPIRVPGYIAQALAWACMRAAPPRAVRESDDVPSTAGETSSSF